MTMAEDISGLKIPVLLPSGHPIYAIQRQCTAGCSEGITSVRRFAFECQSFILFVDGVRLRSS